MQLNEFGEIVRACWLNLPGHYNHVLLDAFVVMPNHIHAVIVLRDYDDNIPGNTVDTTVGAGLREAPLGGRPAPTTTNDDSPKRHALPEIVRAFKSFSSRRINGARNRPGVRRWQRGYYEHVGRSEPDLARIRIYIQDNPAHWTFDEYYTPDKMGR
jgi:putative transposase